MSCLRLSSLRSRLILLVLLAAIPALALILHDAAARRSRALHNVKDSTKRLARLTALEELQLIDGARHVLMALSHVPGVRHGDVEACNELFARLVRDSHRYANFGLIDLEGNVVASGLPMREPVNAADRRYFREALKSESFAVGEYQVGRITGVPSLNLGYPVRDERQVTNGVVFAALNLSWLSQLELEVQAHLPPGYVMTKIDDRGMVLVHPLDPEKWVGRSALRSPLVQRVLAEREGLAEAPGLDGISRLYGFAPLSPSRGSGTVFVIVGVPRAVVLADSDRVLKHSLIWLAIVAAVALTVALLGSHVLILTRVRALTRAVRRLGSGDLSARTGLPEARGVIAELARSFDDMAARLEQAQAERRRLEREVLDIEEQERQQIGRELHDDLGQLLTAIALKSKVQQEVLAKHASPEAARAAEICDLATRAMDRVRALARGLYPVDFEHVDLPLALQDLADSVEDASGLSCQVECPGDVAVPDAMMRTHLHRIAQEAVSNAIKHAEAQQIAIRLASEGGQLILTVEDDGKGLPQDVKCGDTLGWRTMGYRAALLGGSLELEPRPSGGTIVKCRVPCPTKQAAPGES